MMELKFSQHVFRKKFILTLGTFLPVWEEEKSFSEPKTKQLQSFKKMDTTDLPIPKRNMEGEVEWDLFSKRVCYST